MHRRLAFNLPCERNFEKRGSRKLWNRTERRPSSPLQQDGTPAPAPAASN